MSSLYSRILFLVYFYTETKISGPTSTQTQLSEARSYFNLAAANNHWAIVTASQISRIHVEDRALDSHQNILLSILHFWRVQSRWPTHLTIVSHAFKRRRLVQAHCSALSLPLDRVQYVGINPPGIPEVVENEERAVEEWLSDPQGTSEGLRRKRKGRNPWGVEQRLFLDDAERMRSGLTTSIVQDEEILIENSAKPWVEE